MMKRVLRTMVQKENQHIAVMCDRVLSCLGDIKDALIIDGTFGSGGYSRSFLERGARVIALDRDPYAIGIAHSLAACWKDKLNVVETRFSLLDQVVEEPVDAVVLDIGVSSMQLDQAERGFSFLHNGPLDMRMSGSGFSAADVVNEMSVEGLAHIFYVLGEERYAKPIARMIETRRNKKPFTQTKDLAEAIAAMVRFNPNRIHPATRVFQALRIYVNDELEELSRALLAAETILKPGGRLVVVTFHSLEDRIVKRFLLDRTRGQSYSRHLPDLNSKEPTFIPLSKGAEAAEKEEISVNIRARSAKLRAAIRTKGEASSADLTRIGLPDLSRLQKTAFGKTIGRRK